MDSRRLAGCCCALQLSEAPQPGRRCVAKLAFLLHVTPTKPEARCCLPHLQLHAPTRRRTSQTSAPKPAPHFTRCHTSPGGLAQRVETQEDAQTDFPNRHSRCPWHASHPVALLSAPSSRGP